MKIIVIPISVTVVVGAAFRPNELSVVCDDVGMSWAYSKEITIILASGAGLEFRPGVVSDK